ncbi:MAG: choice-of-anchor J domain-containing protein [Bacteroidales bacterium]|nr:choice-of-anchor J domain-containing protein [Bacteroidales bacterium]
MKKLLLLTIALVISSLSFAQLSGPKSIPGDYATIEAAITALNAAGVGSGGVTFNVAAGHTETLTAPLSITATGTLADQIIFQKSGSGANPLITAYVGTATPSSAIQDGMWNLIGSDYVTIDGIDLYDPNSTNPATMEYGFAMFKASVTDGCQYNTIQNCVVTLSIQNNASGSGPSVEGSRAINVTNALVATQTTAVTPTTAAGTNSYNKFYTNTLQNCNYGIVLSGYAAATPFTLGDTGNDIGGTLSTKGNSILNFGGATAATNPAAGIRANNQWGVNITFNTINNNNGSGVNHPSTLRGIFAQAGTSASATIKNNYITLNGGGTTSSLYGIDNGIGSTAASNTVEITNNSVTGSYSTATSGAFYSIQNTASAAVVNVTYNTVSGISTPGTGGLYGMVLGSPTTLNITNNSIGSLTKTGIGLIYGIQASTATITCQNNTIDGLSCTAASSTAAIYGIYDGGSAAVENYSNNIVKNLSTTGTATVCGLYINTATGNKTVQSNQIFNLTVAGGGTIYGIRKAYGSTDVVSDNIIHDLNITGTASGTIYGLYNSAGSPAIYNNSIYALSCAAGTAGAIYGIDLAGGATSNVYKNNVYNLSSGSTNPVVYGVYIVAGTTNNLYNNYISDLRTPATTGLISLAGIYISGGTNANIYYNTVYLNASSTGANFGSAALYASTTPALDMRNNILVNVSTPMGTGVTAAFRRSGTVLTSYSANSNANAFYAGATEDATHAVYFDGTTPYDIAAYKTLVGPSRDAISFRENVPFINGAAAPYDLHVSTSTATYCESGALAITTPFAITDDFDGNTRTATPDVGADEFAGIAAGVVNPGGFAATVISSQQINLGFTLNPSSNNVAIVWNATGTFTAPVGAPPTVGDPFAGGTLLSYGAVSPVSHTGLTPATPYYYKAFSYDGSTYSAGSTATATPSVAAPTALTATAVSAVQINLAYTLNAQANDVVIATAATSTFGTPVNGTALNVNDPISGGGTVIYVGPLAAFNHTGLTASTAYFYKVWSVDAFAYYSATGATANATTPCADISAFPFTESFAATLGCWSFSEAVAGATIHWGTATADATHGAATAQSGAGTYFARIDIYNAGTAYNPYYFTSPSFTLDATAKQVKYYYWLGATGYTLTPVPLTLQVSTNGGSTWTDLYAHTSLNSVFGTASTSPWTQNTVSLAAYTGTTAKFRFVSYSNYGSGFTNQGIDEFVIEDIPSCPAPTALTATNITVSSADLGWTASATNYDIEYGPVGFSLGTGTQVLGVANPYALGGLTSNTAYDYYVRGNCPGSLVSPWAGPKTFTTLCSTTTVPFTENFDSYTVPAVGCGTIVDQNADNVKWANQTGTPYNGLNALKISYSAAGVTQDDWYITQGLTLTGGTSYDVKFYYKGGSASYLESLEVKYGAAPTAAGMTSPAIFSDISFYKAAYTVGGGSFTPATSGTYYLGWHCISIGDQLNIFVDEITVIVTPSCPAPLTATASALSSSSISVGWTGVAPTVQIDYGTVGHTAGTGTLVSSVTANPTTIGGLSASTSYDVFVRQDCGGGLYSTWTGPVTVTTLCGAITAPAAEHFTTTLQPSCWTISGPQNWLFTTTWPGYGATGLADNTPGGGGSFAGVDGSGSVSLTGITLLSPLYDISALTTPRVRFYLFNNNTSSVNLADEQQLTVDLWDGAAWQLGAFVWAYGQNAAGWQEKVINLSSYTITGPIQLRFVVDKGSSLPFYDDIAIDDITIENTPLCPAPSTLTAVAGNFFANLGWTETGTATTWNIEWGTLGFVQGTGTTINGVTNPYTLTGLSATTSYAYYVQADCGASQSDWVGPKTFTTTVACPVPTTLTATNLQKTSADLNWTEVGTATTWNIEWGPTGFAIGTGTTISGVTAKPYTLEGLTAGTGYSFYVQSDCGGSTSTWAGPVSFVTVCGVSTVPTITQTFTGTFAPNCWSKYTGALAAPSTLAVGGNWIQDDWRNVTSPVNKAARLNIWSTTTLSWLMTPEIDLGAGSSTLRLEFDLTLNEYATSTINDLLGSDDKFAVVISTDGGITWTSANTLRLWDNAGSSYVYNDINPNGEHVILSLAGYSGIVKFGFYGESTVSNGDNDLMIDNVIVQEPPLCSNPTSLAVTGVTASSASIGWAGATTVQIDYGAVGHAAGSGTVVPGVTANPYTLGGLAGATSFDVYVRQDCGGGLFSSWVGPVSFTTLCSATLAPFIEGFEGTTFAPTCWSNVAVSGSYTWTRSTAASGFGSGTASAYANFYSQTSGTYDLITLPFDISALATPTLKFDYAYATYSGEPDEMDVYYSIDNGASWNLLLAMPGGSTGILNTAGTTTASFAPTAAQWGSQTLTLPAGTNMVKFTAISAYGNNLFLDNVQVFSPLAHDVAAVSVDFNDIVPLGTVTPMATVKNEGTSTESFDVTLAVDAYTSTKTVTALAPGSSIQVTFDPWTNALGDFTATATTTLATDLNPANNSVSKVIKVLALDKQVYGWTTFTSTDNGPVKFNLNDPGTLTEIVNEYPVTAFASSGTWANDIWYATIYATVAPFNLVTFDIVTGARTVIGNMGVNINGLAYNTVNNTMYGIGYDGVNSLLYTINTTTAATTYVGTIASRLIINLAIDNNGDAYALDLGIDVLGTINLTTGAFTEIGATGFDANYAQDMEFDRETGELYMAAYGSTGELRWVNKTTGATLVIGQFQGGVEVTGFAIPYANTKTLNVNLFLEGLYAGASTMNQAQGLSGAEYGAGIADKVTIELWADTDLSAAAYTFTDLNLMVDGTVAIPDVPGAVSGNYYIVVKHRNSIETWSAAAVSFAGTGPIAYDFSSASSQAYGSNMKVLGGVAIIYGGNANQDAIVDGSDMALIDNASTAVLQGYNPEDCNGDGIVDGSDMAMVDNNSTAVIQVSRP